MLILKTQAEIEQMKISSKLTAEVLKRLEKEIYPGITTGELDKIAESLINEKGGKPSFKGYRGYPASICASLNEEVVHGIPGSRKVKEGDLLKIDIGVFKEGFHGDVTETYAVGRVSLEAKKLKDVTEKALYAGISMVSSENRVGDISSMVQKIAEEEGYTVVREFTGHGIGRNLHEDPQVTNFGKAGTGIRLKEGMVFCIEPMVNMGTAEVEILKDHWTVVTKDRKLSAHYEHTVAIVNGKAEILTRY
ncbi:MAG: type I methionyl aminopeptidase [Candidatus Firestonebacteria bacterium RIFOXYD2_FULL_39_29]|nr:MAG: type I methionyl aminopeptidase [Candidatus Firestonebacteria bacterium RIFOXYD2_FULL_39_29]